MALAISNGGSRILYINRTTNLLRRHVIFFPTSTFTTQSSTRTLLVVSAAKKLSSRTGRFDSKNRRTGSATTTEEDEEQKVQQEQTTSFGIGDNSRVVNNNMVENVGVSVDDGLVLPDLPGEKPDFWEGPQWDAFGFFMQYLWAFGVVFALVACGIAVVTYNEGATDFKETPAYRESVQSRELLEGPEASNSDVFESNPTEVAPSLE